jgi:hypothetical protein
VFVSALVLVPQILFKQRKAAFQAMICREFLLRMSDQRKSKKIESYGQISYALLIAPISEND